MSTFWIITIAILWVGLKAYKGVKKTFADPEETAEMSQPESARPAYETLFDDERAEEEFAYDTFEEEEQKSGYFTYESTEDYAQQAAAASHEVQPPAAESPRSAAAAFVAAPHDEPVEIPQFDLRQAVVFQTILQNKYIPELSRL